MSNETKMRTFRLSDFTIGQLDEIVAYEVQKNVNYPWIAAINRSSVLRSLIEIRLHQINEEALEMEAKLAKAKKKGKALLKKMDKAKAATSTAT